MNARNRSFAAIAAVYAVAFGVGATVFFLVPGGVVLRALLADLAMTLIVFAASLCAKNASLYDPYWSVVPPYLLILAVFAAGTVTASAACVLLALSVWSIRLTWNWATLWTGFGEEDWRYVMIRERAPRLWPWTSLVGIMMFPTLIVFAQLAGAMRLAAATGPVRFLTVAGAALILCGAGLQFVSDRQMACFRERNRGRRACIEDGLWKYSRHPNYFGEVTVWWGVWLAHAAAAGKVDFTILAPLLMTAMFLFISIPMMEKKILSTRPEYGDYRKRVSMLVPFFRRPDDREAPAETE